MAASNWAAGKPGHSGARRPPTSQAKPIIPAIPLPYLRRPQATTPSQQTAPLKKPPTQPAVTLTQGVAREMEQKQAPKPTGKQLNSPDATTSSRTVQGSQPLPEASLPSTPPTMKGPDTGRVPSLPSPWIPSQVGHQPHAHNGSLVFGGFPESKASSPAPLPHDGGPFETMPSPADEHSDRLACPAANSLPLPGLQHQAHHQQHHPHRPSTPHSCQGSQLSIQADETIRGPQRLANGHTSYPGHGVGRFPSQMSPLGQFDHVPGSPASGYTVSRIQAQTLDQVRGSWLDDEFSDCLLQVRLTNTDCRRGHSNLLVIPCHRFIISQSPTLKHFLRTRESSAEEGHGILECHDRFARRDAFEFTLQTLYGWDLGDCDLPGYPVPKTAREVFDVSLGYAASAIFLHLPVVYGKAIRHASLQLNWDTIERAWQFVLADVFQHHSPAPGSLVPAELLDCIIAFLVYNIPTDFVVDVNAGDCGFSRLPVTPKPSPVAQETSTLSHSRQGSVGHTRMPHKPRTSNPRLSLIQFGDLTCNGSLDTSGAPTPSRPPGLVDTVLSRILLNLPFFMLVKVLEHPALAKLSGGEITPGNRHRILTDIVREREARRAQALNNLNSPELQVFADRLKGVSEPLVVQHIGDFLVNNLGFKEEVMPGDADYLGRVWANNPDSSSSS